MCLLLSWSLQYRSSVMYSCHQHFDSVSVPFFLPPLCSGADAIIRQHKAACLRITALLACKDLLWIGTSAGKKNDH